MIIGTVTSAGDLPYAMVMARSVKQNMPDSKVVVGIIEDKIPESALRFPCFDEVILMKDLSSISHSHKFFFQYTVQEAIRSCKALVMKYIYDKYTAEEIMVYLDADMMLYGPLNELPAVLAEHPVVLTGHFIYPETLDPDHLEDVRKSGIHYSGFVALKRHAEAEKYLLWRSKLSAHHGYYDHEQNRFADQDWLDISHHFFEGIYSLRHAGYSVTSLNLIERWNIDQIREDFYVINEQPLRCLQFSPQFQLAAAWIDLGKGAKYNELYNRYLIEVKELERSNLRLSQWSYGCFSSGELITDETKRIFLKNYYENPEIENPFSLSNAYFRMEQENTDTGIMPILVPPVKNAPKLSRKIQVRKTKARRRRLHAIRKKRIRRNG